MRTRDFLSVRHRDPKQLPLRHTHAHFKLPSRLTVPLGIITSRQCYRQIFDTDEDSFFSAEDDGSVDGFEVDVLVGAPVELFGLHVRALSPSQEGRGLGAQGERLVHGGADAFC